MTRLRLLPSLRAKKSPEPDPDETPTAPAIPRARTVTLDDLEDADSPEREIDRILVSYLLDLDRVV